LNRYHRKPGKASPSPIPQQRSIHAARRTPGGARSALNSTSTSASGLDAFPIDPLQKPPTHDHDHWPDIG